MEKKKLNFFYQNTRGLRSKIITGLRNRITLANYDLLGITESWLNDTFDSESIFDESYITHRSDRTNRTYLGPRNRVDGEDFRGGGALIAIKKNISASRVKNWELEVPFDNVWLKINSNNSKKIFINCIYINHGTVFERLNTYLQQLNEIVNLREPDANFIIMGDFNLSIIQWLQVSNRCVAVNYGGRLANELLDTLLLTNLNQVNPILNFLSANP